MSVATRASTVYCGLSDEQLEREVQALATRVNTLKWSTTAAGVALHREFVKRLDEARAALRDPGRECRFPRQRKRGPR